MPSLKDIIDGRETRAGAVFDIAIQVLIVLSLIAYSIGTLPDLPEGWLLLLRYFEVISVMLFTLEYSARLYVAENKLKFATSFFGLIDLLAILPFYVSLGLDLRSVRAFRLLRLLRVLKLARYNRAAMRFHRALLIAREEIVLFLFATLILLYLSAVGIYYFEHDEQPEVFASVFHSLWWAVVTLTTVGYGDVTPHTVGGRIFTFAVLLVGLGVVSIPAGLVASALSKAREIEEEQAEDDTPNGSIS